MHTLMVHSSSYVGISRHMQHVDTSFSPSSFDNDVVVVVFDVDVAVSSIAALFVGMAVAPFFIFWPDSFLDSLNMNDGESPPLVFFRPDSFPHSSLNEDHGDRPPSPPPKTCSCVLRARRRGNEGGKLSSRLPGVDGRVPRVRAARCDLHSHVDTSALHMTPFPHFRARFRTWHTFFVPAMLT